MSDLNGMILKRANEMNVNQEECVLWMNDADVLMPIGLNIYRQHCSVRQQRHSTTLKPFAVLFKSKCIHYSYQLMRNANASAQFNQTHQKYGIK